MSVDRLRHTLAARYTIERELGQGGMATVYLAEDVRHRRRVALKVLHPELSAVLGPERFLKEIELTASLQHPHILPLFDSGEMSGQLFYVMPFVDGETLRGRLERERQLPVAEAVRLAREVADALQYAHGRGIVHRDIKPENILLQGGHALVADFGIALAVQQAGGQRMTQTGLSLGTPQYMAPEQAMGEKAVDGRADIYALGAVTYEMLTGEAPFTGATAQVIVARVLTEQPRSVTAQRHTVPAQLDAAVRRALEKLPADRFQTAEQFADAMTVATHTDSPAMARTPGRMRGRSWIGRVVPWGLVATLGVALVAQRFRTADSPVGSEPFRFPVELAPGLVPTRVPTVLLSSDATRLVFSVWAAGRHVLYSQKLGELTATPIAGTEGAQRPFLSPDGRWVGFNRGDKLMKVAIDGGTPIALTTDFWGGGSWGRDGRIVFSQSYQEGLFEVSESGGAATRLTRPDSSKNELAHWWPQILPDGDHILFTAYRGTAEATTIEVFSRKTKQRTVLLTDGMNAHYVSSGHLVFAKDETLLAVPFDLGALKVTGGAVPLTEDLAMADGEGYAAFDIAPNGTLVYLPSSSFRAELDVVFVDRRGFARSALPDPARYDNPRLSPDGTRIAVDLLPKGGTSDIWVFPVGSSRGTRITDSPAKDFIPHWTPDGRELVYIHESPYYEPWIRVADASQPARRLIGGGIDRMPGSISADGRLVAYLANLNGTPELRTMSLRGEPKERVYVSNVLNSAKPVLSPDGRWMAYESEETGRVEVYLQSFPDPTLGRWKLSSNGASEPVWSRAGKEVVFRQRDTVMSVAVNPDAKEIGTPIPLFGGPYVFHAAWDEGHSYDVTKDGETFVMLREPPGRQRRRIVVTFNWLAELQAKVPR
jgi:Tol biopolymer transport system component/tRNA A-37 threonylcarbamoyl transferase component Bud32